MGYLMDTHDKAVKMLDVETMCGCLYEIRGTSTIDVKRMEKRAVRLNTPYWPFIY